MRVKVLELASWNIVIALAIALASVGFAHRTVSTAMTPALAAYVAAGGQLGDLCGTAGEGRASATQDCEACRMAENILTPGAGWIGFSQLAKTRVFAFVAKRISERNDLDPARLSRAPPRA